MNEKRTPKIYVSIIFMPWQCEWPNEVYAKNALVIRIMSVTLLRVGTNKAG